ncbi:DUF5103 domain-containing protein [Flavihumibacter rivuli]|uniref:type IX secretion system plug protein n=1 Tax=Flavihumibacter rivuli TaxID=2838156 RepID=UPI001BDEC170|nr:DUF5103 domain-containing protein [Flavihumibacter rivuli]ULQ57209.1 DUF5103 domain-containing protein [Flavihumibacter rivuli]
MRSVFTICCLVLAALSSYAQEPDMTYLSNIQTVKLHPIGNALGYPIIRLGTDDRLELHFDDMEADVKSYSYTWQLCNADWTPAMLSSMDFIKGYSQQRLTTYRSSSVALQRYTHYTQNLPDRNCMPSRSGNYLLKVFLNGDPSQLAFTRRVLVVEEKSSIALQIQQPFNNQVFTTHQKVVFTVAVRNNLNMANAQQQLSVTILQNHRWDNARTGLRPTFIRQNTFEFNPEDQAVFPGGREWRWLDLRSFRLQSDRVDSAVYNDKSTRVFVKTDQDRSAQRFVFFRDMNGMFYNETIDRLNPYWQGDYATVYFTYKPPAGIPFKKDLYLFGEMTNYGKNPEAKMVFNKEKGVYETAIWLKQGYYDYGYALMEESGGRKIFIGDRTEGNFWETENNYLVLVYYRPLGGRTDELIGLGRVNSLTGRKGYNF